MLRRLALVVSAALALAPPAHAGPVIDRTVEALRHDPVYVHPNAEPPITEREAERLRDRIAESGAGPMYVALLPGDARDEAGGDASEVLRTIAERLRREGTYAVVVGGQFRAASSVLEGGQAGRLATEAFERHGADGVAPTLLAFVSAVGEARQGGGEAERERGGGSALWLFALVGGGVLAFFLLQKRRARQEESAEVAEVKKEAEEDLLALGEDIRALDLDVEMPGADPAARDDYGRALDAYERADRALTRARTPDDLQDVSAALEEGRYAMAAAKARLEGRKPPEHRPPCFFDPRHGPSMTEVEWAPPGGTPRPVPVCAADAARIADGLDPQAREVLVGGERRPYWDAPPAFAPYAGGFFAPFGIFPALLMGTMVGPALAGPFVGDEVDPGAGELEDGDFGGGDFGGDFGGGDVGGGDF